MKKTVFTTGRFSLKRSFFSCYCCDVRPQTMDPMSDPSRFNQTQICSIVLNIKFFFSFFLRLYSCSNFSLCTGFISFVKNKDFSFGNNCDLNHHRNGRIIIIIFIFHTRHCFECIEFLATGFLLFKHITLTHVLIWFNMILITYLLSHVPLNKQIDFTLTQQKQPQKHTRHTKREI